MSPFAPHIAEELWQRLGHENTLAYEPWPEYDEKYLVQDRVEVVIQINGKVRSKMVLPTNEAADRNVLQEKALQLEDVQKRIEGKTVRKVISVPGKLVNIVAN